jgi:hypothetical protein
MLVGMIGLRGILPPGFGDDLANWVIGNNHSSESFSNLLTVLFPATRAWLMNRTYGLATLALGFFLVWSCPNIRQIMRNFKPALDDMQKTQTELKMQKACWMDFLHWRMQSRYAVALGLLFFFCLISMSKVREFLYWQF